MSICYNVPLYLITVVLLWSYYVFGYLYCFTYLVTTVYKVILLVFYNIFFFLFFWCTWATALIKMYEVPFQYKVSNRDHLILLQLKEADRHRILEEVCMRTGLRIYTRSPAGYLRYCSICQHIKPDRTHHCSACGRCVLKMDHHCPFVNNCIGLANYKHFVLMLFYGFVYTLFYSSSTFPFLLKFCQAPSEYKNHVHIQIVAAWSLTFLGSILFTFFTCRHFVFILKNQTSWEAKFAPLFENSDLSFDIGTCNNFISVFGKRPVIWCCPTQSVLEALEDVSFPITVIEACFLTALFWILYAAFGAFHLTLVWKNETTLESLKAPIFVESDLTFDLGVKLNFQSVFGESWWLWWLPRGILHEDEGVHFPITRKVDSYPSSSFILYTQA